VPYAQVQYLATTPELRRRGLAQLLLAALQHHAAQACMQVATVLVERGTQAFWQHMGYGKAQGCNALATHVSYAETNHSLGNVRNIILARHIGQVGCEPCISTVCTLLVVPA
jgi:GNAT superfamily N-acetyltransferase